ncbi:PucR family transcriptional regulator [Murimonas intestini]|uniref:CdaR family transcriptional regulator n=1 Tax=Murimonas intestini TaxID=1337051 RepID=A0AB73SY80_9FIRM|nr:helix-turn-helix domain-containing protein [Murimonas intestini]MCR1843077.1 helix-turn-helix domain-containing protein [Murimonas intestini]MCR1868386.1 helix-turn-helix domain-containing protein [Murimonas intestini]MCR1885830.1 helix-turn-helix domain-containing protein [Murimonas intestini]
MISSQVLQNAIDELRAITRIDLCVLDLEGRNVVSTFQGDDIPSDTVRLFVESAADSQVIQGYHFFKIFDDRSVEYVLVARGSSEDAYMIGKVAVSEIQNLIVAYKERFDKNNFIQNLLLDNLLLVDIYNRAKKLHIEVEAKRVVFMIETKYEKDSNAMETVKSLFAARTKDFITAVDEKSIIIVRELREDETYEELETVAQTMRDMLNSEAMTSVRISYGTIVNEIKQVSKSYKEAKMALDVGKIFYSEKTVIAYSTLGIGRLIYQLPIPLCEMFMREVFGENMPDTFDDETLMTINKFFENNLNVSETSRQLYVHRNTLVYRLEKLQKSTGLDIRVFDDALTFKIALMVVSYMKYMEKQDY